MYEYAQCKPALLYDYPLVYQIVEIQYKNSLTWYKNSLNTEQKYLTVIGIFIFPNNHTNYSTLLLLQFGTIPTRLLSFSTRKVSGCLEPALLVEHG